jgi:twitching motility protein PilT
VDANQPYDGQHGFVPAEATADPVWAPPAPSSFEASPAVTFGGPSYPPAEAPTYPVAEVPTYAQAEPPSYPAPSEPFPVPGLAPEFPTPAYEGAPSHVYAAAAAYETQFAAPAAPEPVYPAGTLYEPPTAREPFVEAYVEVPEQPAAPESQDEGQYYAEGDDYSDRVRLGAEDTSVDSGFLTELLIEVLERSCSDLHLTVGAPPTVRQHGHLTPVEGRPKMTPQTLQRVLYAIMSQKQREKFEEELELDFAYSVPGRARFRVNVYRQRDSLGAAFRLIPYEIRPLEALGVPPSVANFAMLPRGFVLVTGPTGSGKSTTLAAIVDLANRQRRDHIMTVEDPIEFLHEHKSCLVNQREVGEDTHTFKNALKHVLRQDPDLILVGEMRDLETIEIALTAAETGHLVFGTLHTNSAHKTVDRIIDTFPADQQEQVRAMLSESLRGVVAQQLLKKKGGGRVAAHEILVGTPAVGNLIREAKTFQLPSIIQTGKQHGMMQMDQSLQALVASGTVETEEAYLKAHDKSLFRPHLEAAGNGR